MIEITLKVRTVLLILDFVSFGMAFGNFLTDRTDDHEYLGHWLFWLGELVGMLLVVLVTIFWVK